MTIESAMLINFMNSFYSFIQQTLSFAFLFENATAGLQKSRTFKATLLLNSASLIALHWLTIIKKFHTFRCPKCDFDTKSEQDYKNHLKEEHNLTPEDLDDDQVKI